MFRVSLRWFKKSGHFFKRTNWLYRNMSCLTHYFFTEKPSKKRGLFGKKITLPARGAFSKIALRT